MLTLILAERLFCHLRFFSFAVTHLCRSDTETKVFVIRYLRVDAKEPKTGVTRRQCLHV